MPSIEKFREEIASLDEIGLKRNEKEIIIQRKLREFLDEAVSVPRDFVTSFLVDLEKIANTMNIYQYREAKNSVNTKELSCQKRLFILSIIISGCH